MPCYIRLLTPEGLQPITYAAESLADAVSHEPADGIYTVTNTYHTTKTLKLHAHLDRMEDSARRAGISLQLDRTRLRHALREMILDAGYGDVRFRLTVGARNPASVLISLEPYHPPADDLIQVGVRCITAPNSARQNAEAKTTGWMSARQRLADAMPPDIYDTFLLDTNGNILEGLASNFYATLYGVLYTAGSGVLKGISRQIVLHVAPPILPVNESPAHVSQIPRMEEAFLSSSSRGIIPVIEIDGIPIGGGIPGENTRRLRTAYQSWVNDHLEEL